MRSVVALLIALVALFAVPAQGQDGRARQVIYETTIVEQWDPATGIWVEVTGAERLVAARQAPATQAIATYGPFRALGGGRAALAGTTDAQSPIHFAQLLRDFPQLKTLELVDVAGTRDDTANMTVGRMIRSAGLTTHVPRHGSVRSGGVELFLAGAQRSIDEGAEFAVHSWLDSLGLQPQHYTLEHEANRIYLDYYAEMGMTPQRAQAFYAMTNSVPHRDALWLDAGDMRGWVDTVNAAPKEDAVPQLEYAAFGGEIIALPPLSSVDSFAALP